MEACTHDAHRAMILASWPTARGANKRAKMALDRSPDFLRLLQSIFFLSLSGKNLQEFLYVCTVQEASIH